MGGRGVLPGYLLGPGRYPMAYYLCPGRYHMAYYLVPRYPHPVGYPSRTTRVTQRRMFVPRRHTQTSSLRQSVPRRHTLTSVLRLPPARVGLLSFFYTLYAQAASLDSSAVRGDVQEGDCRMRRRSGTFLSRRQTLALLHADEHLRGHLFTEITGEPSLYVDGHKQGK